MTSEATAYEGVGEAYSLERMLEARRRTQDVIAAIAAQMSVGMLEEEGVAIAQNVLKEAGMQRGWHGLKLRFGQNTLKNFAEPSEPNVRLGGNDIFFIDIGPVWQKWEGDGGDTFVVGNDAEMAAIKRDVRVVFDKAKDKWRADGASGTALYEYAARAAEDLGWVLNLDMSGHRLGDFPHSAFHKGPLADLTMTPSSGLWVLEIQIRHPTKPFGAFYEDMLLDG